MKQNKCMYCETVGEANCPHHGSDSIEQGLKNERKAKKLPKKNICPK